MFDVLYEPVYPKHLLDFAELQPSPVTLPNHIVPFDTLIAIIGNNTLIPESFSLKPKDRQKINEFSYPGKSAHLMVTENVGTVCLMLFGRTSRRTDYLYIVEAGDLERIGYHPFYTPSYVNGLHVRLVHETHRIDPWAADTPLSARQDLVSLLQSNKSGSRRVFS